MANLACPNDRSACVPMLIRFPLLVIASVRSPRSRDAGLTLVEVMVTLAVIIIMLAVGIPSADTLVGRNRLANQTNDFVSTLVLARSEAVKRRMPVAICSSTDQATCSDSTDWSTGWIVFTDGSGEGGTLDATDELIFAHGDLTGNSSFTSTANSISYRTNGNLSTAASPVFTLTGSNCASIKRRTITVMPPGYSTLQKTTCS